MAQLEGNYTTTTKYQYNEVNELTSLNVNDGPLTQFQYDKNGNRTAKIKPDNVVTSYLWDYENRLTEVKFHQGKRVGYEYDGDGNRITKLSAMSLPTYKHDNGKGNDAGFTPPGQSKAKKQQADLQFTIMAKGGNKGGGGSGGSGGNSGGSKGNSGGNSGGKSGKDKSDKTDNGKSNGKVSNKSLNKNLNAEQREKKKQQSKAKKGYRQKGKYNNKGKHLGWYKNGKISAEQAGEHVDITNYLNDVSDPLTQVLMTYTDDKQYFAAYTYGLERIEVEALDETRPESQDPLYYLYDGLGSVAHMVKPDGNTRDHYNYDEYGKPAPGNSKLSPDGVINLHNTFGYTGEMWDEESKLLYLRARYYEPETGRFLSRDTYGGVASDPLSLNRYTYVANNPLNYSDPSGNIAIKVGNTYLPTYLKNGKMMVSAERLAYALKYSVQHIKNGSRKGNYIVWMRNGKGYEYTAPNHGLLDLLNQWGILTSGVIPLHGSDYSVWGMYCHYRRDGKGEKLEKYGVVAVAAGGVPIVISWAGEMLAPIAATQVDKLAAVIKNLPYYENAAIDMRKLTEYALNPNHPVGGNKARVFESVLGYTQSTAQQLANQIISKLPQSEAVLGTLDKYGQRYTVDISIEGINGVSAVVRTGWIIAPNSTTPQLTTLFVK